MLMDKLKEKFSDQELGEILTKTRAMIHVSRWSEIEYAGTAMHSSCRIYIYIYIYIYICNSETLYFQSGL